MSSLEAINSIGSVNFNAHFKGLLSNIFNLIFARIESLIKNKKNLTKNDGIIVSFYANSIASYSKSQKELSTILAET